MRPIRVATILGVALVTLLTAHAAFAAEPTVYSADFEGGVVPASWQTIIEPGRSAVEVSSLQAHTGTYALRERILDGTPDHTGSTLLTAVRGDGVKYELDGWFFVDSLTAYGMCSTPFMLLDADNHPVGAQFAAGPGGGADGYWGPYQGALPSDALSPVAVSLQAWHHVVVTYDVAAQTEDITLDGTVLAQGLAVQGMGAPVKAVVYASGGWGGYGIDQYVDDVTLRVWTADTPEPAAPVNVRIDVRPGNPTNVVNVGSRARIAVAVFGAEDLDVSAVDAGSVRLGKAAPIGTPSLTDVDGDGRTDIVLTFVADEIGLTGDSTKVYLTGATTGGATFEGSDAVRVVPVVRTGKQSLRLHRSFYRRR